MCRPEPNNERLCVLCPHSGTKRTRFGLGLEALSGPDWMRSPSDWALPGTGVTPGGKPTTTVFPEEESDLLHESDLEQHGVIAHEASRVGQIPQSCRFATGFFESRLTLLACVDDLSKGPLQIAGKHDVLEVDGEELDAVRLEILRAQLEHPRAQRGSGQQGARRSRFHR